MYAPINRSLLTAIEPRSIVIESRMFCEMHFSSKGFVDSETKFKDVSSAKAVATATNDSPLDSGRL